MQKRIDESFWDGLGVEIEARADFPPKVGFREHFPGPGKKSRPEKKISDWMLWVVNTILIPRMLSIALAHWGPAPSLLLVAFRRAFARSRGVKNMDLSEKYFFWERREKKSEFDSGVRFSESATSVFSPMGYRSKELSKKDGFSMKNVNQGLFTTQDFGAVFWRGTISTP